MKVKIEERRKFPINNQKHFERKQDPFLRPETLSHHKNKYIKLHYRNNIPTEEKINNVYVKNHELNRTKLRNLRKENTNHYSSD